MHSTGLFLQWHVSNIIELVYQRFFKWDRFIKADCRIQLSFIIPHYSENILADVFPTSILLVAGIRFLTVFCSKTGTVFA